MQTKNHLQNWISDPRGVQFFGRATTIKCAVLAHFITGQDTLTEIARRNGVSRQAVQRIARRARVVYPELTTEQHNVVSGL